MIAGGTLARRITAGENGVWNVRNVVTWHVPPEALEIVIAAGLFAEDVHDEAGEIEQGPVGRAAAFTMFRFAL